MGDLRPYLCGFFDTTSGAKVESSSYRNIALSLGKCKGEKGQGSIVWLYFDIPIAPVPHYSDRSGSAVRGSRSRNSDRYTSSFRVKATRQQVYDAATHITADGSGVDYITRFTLHARKRRARAWGVSL